MLVTDDLVLAFREESSFWQIKMNLHEFGQNKGLFQLKELPRELLVQNRFS